MNELRQLRNLKRTESVSGSSMLAGHLVCSWLNFNSVDGIADNLEELVTKRIQRSCGKTIDVWAIAKGKLGPFHTVAHYVAAAYDEQLFDGATLHALPDNKVGECPRFIIYATNMQSGVSLRFFRTCMADYRIDLNLNTASVRIADAVPSPKAMWRGMVGNPVTGALIHQCDAVERDGVARAVLEAFEKRAGGSDRRLLLNASFRVLVARWSD